MTVRRWMAGYRRTDQLVMARLATFAAARSGNTAIEYALIAGGMTVMLAATVPSVGGALASAFEVVAAAVASMVD